MPTMIFRISLSTARNRSLLHAANSLPFSIFRALPNFVKIFAKAILPSDKQRRHSSQTTAKEKFAD
jgi:hypothetical protein